MSSVNTSPKSINTRSRKQLPTKSGSKRKGPKKNNYRFWSVSENALYLNYLKTHWEIVQSKEQRKRVRIFREISRVVKTRNPLQVKSHHQKMLKQCRSLNQLVSYLQRSISLENGKQKSQLISQVETKLSNEKLSFLQCQFKDSQSPILREPQSNCFSDDKLFDILEFYAQESFSYQHNHEEWELQI